MRCQALDAIMCVSACGRFPVINGNVLSCVLPICTAQAEIDRYQRKELQVT